MEHETQKCHYCNRDVSADGKNCPHCGAPLSYDDWEHGEIPQGQVRFIVLFVILGMSVCYSFLTQWKNQWIGYLGAVVVAVPLLIVGIGISRLFWR